MKNYFFWLLLFFFQIGFAQQNQNWKGYFSYNQINDISESLNKVYTAAENALFTKNLTSNDIQTINTVDVGVITFINVKLSIVYIHLTVIYLQNIYFLF